MRQRRFGAILLAFFLLFLAVPTAEAKTNGRWPVVVDGQRFYAIEFHLLMASNARRLRTLAPQLGRATFTPQFTNLGSRKWQTKAEIEAMIRKMLALKAILDRDGAPNYLARSLKDYRRGTRPLAASPRSSIPSPQPPTASPQLPAPTAPTAASESPQLQIPSPQLPAPSPQVRVIGFTWVIWLFGLVAATFFVIALMLSNHNAQLNHLIKMYRNERPQIIEQSEQLQRDNEQLRTQLAQESQAVGLFEARVRELNNKNQEQQAAIGEQQKTIVDQTNRLAAQEKQIEGLERQLTAANDATQAAVTQATELEKQLADLRQVTETVKIESPMAAIRRPRRTKLSSPSPERLEISEPPPIPGLGDE